MNAAFFVLLAVASERPIVVSMGQSLGIGVVVNAFNNAQTGDNKMCESGRRGINTLNYDITSPASTLEPARSFNVAACNPWPSVCLFGYVDPPVLGAQDHYTTLTGRNTYSAVMARDSTGYGAVFQPGGVAFNYLNLQLAAYGSNADPGYCAGLYVIHGETDHLTGTATATYVSYLVQLRNDVQNICNAVTQQRGRTVVAYIDQVSSYTSAGMGSSTSSAIDMAQYLAAKTYPSTHKLTSAKYIAPGASGYDSCCHAYNGATSHYWGNMVGKAMVYNELSGGLWEPLWPVAYARSGANVVVTYNVPEPPMKLGTDCDGGGITVTAPADGNFGFSYSTSAISSVALCTATDTPIAGCFAPSTCSGVNAPVTGCARAGQNVAAVSYVLTTPGTGVARYASVGTAGAKPGQVTGVRGMLCDSDPTTANGYSLKNWGIQTGLAALDTVP